ncbi:MAG: WecB/TagA/CpsF family glycosyltransferase [Chthoniobacterales bacterium]|nr:WecB/TagA/CpsF family glycosyltransferase [Chthoniobacterales bacterium]
MTHSRMNSTQRILGLPFFTGSVEEAVAEALRGALVVAPSGPNLAGELRRVPHYRRSVETADVVLTDSAVMVSVFRMATGIAVPRHSGLKFLEAILDRPELKEPGAVFWVMPTKAEGDAIAGWLRARGFPVGEDNTHVAPFYRAYPIEDPDLLARLQSARPRVVFLNLAGGKQEVLGAWLRERLDPRPGIICTGAAVAFLAGTQATIPVWADRSGLGWLMRCLSEPRKFVPRYWSALPLLGLVWRHRQHSPVKQDAGTFP